MAWLFAFVGVVVVAVAAAVLSRANEMFYIEYRRPILLVIRGGVPPALVAEFKDVLKRGPGPVSLRCVRESRTSRLIVMGVNPGVAQQLRNVFALYPIGFGRQARHAPRNLGQTLGIAWLAWLAVKHTKR